MIAPDLYLGCTVGEMARLAGRRYPDRDALVYNDRRFTFRELEAQVSRMVQVLKAHGCKRGEGIAMLASNSVEVLLVSAAAQAIGLRYTPLHPLGGEDDHVFVLEDAEISVLVVDDHRFAARGRVLKERVKSLRSLFTIGPTDFGIDVTSEMARFAPQPIVVEARPEDITGISYTGGTTGRPKGVVHRHRSYITLVLLELSEWEWPEEIRFLAATPVSHAAGAFIAPVHLRGGTFIMQDGFDPEKFMATIERERVTATFLVPTMLYVLLDHPKLKDYDLSSLKMCVYGAAPMSPTRLKEALEVFGPIFCQLYAQTEAPNTVTYLRKGDHDLAHPHRLASCGQPIAGIRVRILDEECREVPRGEIGEICVRGPLVMDGYWKRPEETEKAFRGGWLHTGDMAREDEDGFFYIVDRAKDMIISGGFNVYPREVEDALTQHPSVSVAAVIGVPDPKWGELVKAFCVLKPGANAGEKELIEHVKQKKGSVYAPKSIDFVDSLPVTALGKLDKKALRAAYWKSGERQVS
ncbi:MAG: AMP-binding protein [Alphaproteobacteria bacterium]|nr:AMP-binding protein [Alphaproteobacteria bacterium]